MKRLLATTAVLVALWAPTAQAEPDDNTQTLSTAIVYDQYCEHMPAGTIKLLGFMAQGSKFDQAKASTIAMNTYMALGHDVWCAVLKPNMDKINDSAAPISDVLK